MEEKEGNWKRVMEALAMIPMALAVIFLGLITALMMVMIYFAAYVLPLVGLLLIANGALLLDPVTIVVGISLAGFGGLCYMEWMDNEVPTVTELVSRVRQSKHCPLK